MLRFLVALLCFLVAATAFVPKLQSNNNVAATRLYETDKPNKISLGKQLAGLAQIFNRPRYDWVNGKPEADGKPASRGNMDWLNKPPKKGTPSTTVKKSR
jgi:hypothetical protein